MNINLKDLEGKWYINQSNFPMWLKGNKLYPTFNYTIIEKNNQKQLDDRVEYVQNGSIKSINGIDKPLNGYNTKFEWRGKGLLFLLTSKWEILYFNKEEQWAIIHFEKSLVSPKGYDVISRHKMLSEELKNNVQNKLNELGVNDILQFIDQK